MTDVRQPGDGADQTGGPTSSGPLPSDDRRGAARREVFGDVLPDRTSDERGPDSDWRDEDHRDDWLRREVPPHH